MPSISVLLADQNIMTQYNRKDYDDSNTGLSREFVGPPYKNLLRRINRHKVTFLSVETSLQTRQ